MGARALTEADHKAYSSCLGLETLSNGGTPPSTGVFLCPKFALTYVESEANTRPERGISPPDHWPVSSSRRQGACLGAASKANQWSKSMRKLDSKFVIVDVERGCHALAKKVKAGKRFRVCIDVVIDNQHSKFDGTSIEFSGSDVIAKIEEI